MDTLKNFGLINSNFPYYKMNCKKNIINHLFIIAFLFVAQLHSQNILSGSITSENNEPLSALIYLPQLEIGTISDSNGVYTIKDIPTGSYTVVYSMMGYSTISLKIEFINSEEVIQNIQLSESVVEMEEVIISTPFHKLQSDNVMKVERIGMAHLKSQGAVSLMEGITSIAGVSSITTGIGIGKPVIRGLSANRVLTYAQGVRLENQQFGDEHGLGINESGIESVEVIKGPASLLYGSDAIGGVLYLNPEKFADPGSFESDLLSTYSSNTLGFSNNLGIKTSSDNFKFLARGAYTTHSDYKTGDGMRVTNSRFNEADFKTGVRYQNSRFKSTLRYNYNRSNIGIPEEIGMQDTGKKMMSPFQEIDNHILSLENDIFLKNSSIHIKTGYLFNDRREFEEEEGQENSSAGPVEPELRLKLNTWNYDVKYNLPQYGKFETIAGFQGMFQKNKNFGEEQLIPDAEVKDFGIFATTHYHLDRIDIQAGLRFDSRTLDTEASGLITDDDYVASIAKTFTSFNAALGTKVDLNDRMKVRLNLASGFRAPNLSELTSNGIHEGTNRYEIGNQYLNNEQNFQTDISFEVNSEHFELYANGFYNLINDYIYISPTGEIIESTDVYEYLQKNASLYGGEIGFHLHPHPIHWLHFESSFESVTGKIDNEGHLPLIPANSLQNTIRIEFDNTSIFKDSRAFISLKSTFSQKNIYTFETKSDSYNLVSIGGSTRITFNKFDLNLSLNITNLLDESYISHLSRLKSEEIPNMGRNINLSLGINI